MRGRRENERMLKRYRDIEAVQRRSNEREGRAGKGRRREEREALM